MAVTAASRTTTATAATTLGGSGVAAGIGSPSGTGGYASGGEFSAASTAHAVPDHYTTFDRATPSTLAASHTHAHTGVFTLHRSLGQINEALKAASAARHIDALTAGVASLGARADQRRAQMNQERALAASISSDISALESELAAAASLPNALQRRTREFGLQQQLGVAREKLRQQTEVVTRAQRSFEEMDLARDRCASELAQLDSLQVLLRQRKEEENYQYTLLAQASEAHNARLRARAAAKIARTTEAARREEEQEAELMRVNHARAAEAHAKHAEEMARSAAHIAEREAALAALLEEALEARKGSILALKASTAAAHNDLLAKNARRKAREARREQQRDHERKELEGAGRNADAIFAARDEEARMARIAARIVQNQVERGAQLENQMAQESVKIERAALAAMKDAAVVADYKRKMGHSVIDTTAAAMEAARARREAKRRNDEALAVAALDAKRFVPDDASEASDDDMHPSSGSAAQKFAQGQGGVALSNFLAIQHDEPEGAAGAPADPAVDSSDDDTGGAAPSDRLLLSPTEELAAFKRENRVEGFNYNEWGLRLIPNHSNIYRQRLDNRKIALAHAAQQARLASGTPMLVCGKDYSHVSKFLSSPTKIVFHDFTVGEEMSQTITITNVSFAFNHFKILPLEDRVLDFFEVVYVPVGRMSAGSVAKVTVRFKPKVNEDLDTVLPMLAETGPFSVAIECRTKKAVIRVAPSPILDMGVCVLGDETQAAFEIENQGAIPVDFWVEHIAVPRPVEALEREKAGAKIFHKLSTAGLQPEEEEKQASPDARPQTVPAGSTGAAASAADVKPLNFTGLIPASAVVPTDSQAEASLLSVAPCSETEAAPMLPGQISNEPNFHRSAEDDALAASLAADELAYTLNYLTFPTSGRVEAYSKTHWPLTFRPLIDGAWVHTFKLHFGPRSYAKGVKPLRWGSGQDFEVQVTGEGSKVPIYIENDLLDFKATAYGKLYRSEIILRNRHSTAHKIHMHYPRHLRALSEFIEFNPKVGYIQKHDTLKVQVKLRPSKEMWSMLRALTLASSEGNISEEQYEIGHVFIPFSIEVQDQTLPVLWALSARLVDLALGLSLRRLDFGRVFTTESKALTLTVTNRSPLLQKFAFVHLPAEVTVEPYGGMLVLPPFRSLECNIVFSPGAAIDYALTVEIRSKLGEHLHLPLVGQGVAPPIHVQHPSISFAATPNFTSAFQNTMVTNLSAKHRQTVQFIVDEPEEDDTLAQSIHSQRSFLSFFPSVIALEPASTEKLSTDSPSPSSPSASTGNGGGSGKKGAALPVNKAQARVEVQFRPFLNLDELYAHINAPAHDDEESRDDEKHTEDPIPPPQEEKVSSPKAGARSQKKDAVSAGAPKSTKKKKLTAEQEAEVARKAAAEAELKRLEDEKAAAAAEAAAQAAAHAAAQAAESNSRAALDARHKLQSSNDRPTKDFVQFSDRLLLQIDAAKATIAQAQMRLDQLERERRLDGDISDDEEEKYEGDVERSAAPDNEKIVIPEPFSRHARHRVAVHIRSEHVVTGEVSLSCMWMELSTTLVLPLLEVKPHVLDFDQISLGKAKTASFEVRNTSETKSIQLTADSLGFAPNFSILNALRCLAPGEIQIVVVEFRPRREGKRFKQDLVLRSEADPNVQVVVPLVGLCISPDLEIILPPVTSEANKSLPTMSTLADGACVQLMHLGDCVAGQSVSRSFTVRNKSVYPFAFQITHDPVQDSEAHAAHVLGSEGSVSASTTNIAAGSPPEFYFVPSAGVIPANGGCASITLVFTPTSPTSFFPYQTVMRVGNVQMHVQAEVHERQVFVSGGRQIRSSAMNIAAPPTASGAPVSTSLATLVQQASFQPKSLVAGTTHLSTLIYQNPLAFLDGPGPTQASVGGGAIASVYPLLMADALSIASGGGATAAPSIWDRVGLLGEEGVISKPESTTADKKGKKGGNKGDKEKKGGADGSSSSTKKDASASSDSRKGGSAAGSSIPFGAEGFDPTAVANAQVQLTFDANRIVDLSHAVAAPATTGKGGRKDRAAHAAASADGSSAPPAALYLVETLQIGSCLLGNGQAPEPSERSGGGGKDKDALGSYEITLHAVRDSDKKSSGVSNHSSALDPDSLLSLFVVEPASGNVRAGGKDSVHFMFDWSTYCQIKAAGQTQTQGRPELYIACMRSLLVGPCPSLLLLCVLSCLFFCVFRCRASRFVCRPVVGVFCAHQHPRRLHSRASAQHAIDRRQDARICRVDSDITRIEVACIFFPLRLALSRSVDPAHTLFTLHSSNHATTDSHAASACICIGWRGLKSQRCARRWVE